MSALAALKDASYGGLVGALIQSGVQLNEQASVGNAPATVKVDRVASDFGVRLSAVPTSPSPGANSARAFRARIGAVEAPLEKVSVARMPAVKLALKETHESIRNGDFQEAGRRMEELKLMDETLRRDGVQVVGLKGQIQRFDKVMNDPEHRAALNLQRLREAYDRQLAAAPSADPQNNLGARSRVSPRPGV